MSDFGTLSSLGAGSDGVLSYNVIDKLKNADKDIMVKPLEEKLDLVKKRDKALSQFITIASTVKSDISDIADGTLFAKVTTNVNGSSVSVNANDGVKPQNFDVNVKQLAQNDVYQSEGFDSEDSTVNSSGNDIKLDIGVGDNTTKITVKAGATLSDLKDAINNADIGITAKIIDTGSDSKPYKLILKANDTGKDNIIKFDYGKISDLGFNQTVYESASYDADTDKVNDSGDTQTFKITINGTDYSMDVADGTEVKDFVDDINNGDLKDSDGNSLEGVSAKYEDGHIKIHLQQIGDISITDDNLTTNMNDNTDFSDSNRIQTAKNSVFDYDGVEVTRSNNKIKDLINGVEINLNSTGDSRVSIQNNVDDITKSIQQFVADYNSMTSNLQSLTAFNKESGNVGLFQGNSDFTMISSTLSSDLFNTTMSYTVKKHDLNGFAYDAKSFFSAADLGLSMNRNGLLSFDASKFKKAYEKNPDIVKQFSTTTFTKVSSDFERIATGDHSSLNLLSQEIKREEKDYQKRMEAMNKYLDTKYDTMAHQFAAYDGMIEQFNVQSQSLTMAIQQAINSKG